jgi:hypothetical protein
VECRKWSDCASAATDWFVAALPCPGEKNCAVQSICSCYVLQGQSDYQGDTPLADMAAGEVDQIVYVVDEAEQFRRAAKLSADLFCDRKLHSGAIYGFIQQRLRAGNRVSADRQNSASQLASRV